MSFEAQLQVGQLGESLIARWLIKRGWIVLPAYEKEIDNGKGPRLFTGFGQIVSPDLLAFRDSDVKWIEAKSKSSFTWHRKTGTWQTGLDRRHWREYLMVNVLCRFPIWILFLHKPGNAAKDTPAGLVSPSGLFGREIGYLANHIDHEHENHGPSGMVYWRCESLIKIAKFEELA